MDVLRHIKGSVIWKELINQIAYVRVYQKRTTRIFVFSQLLLLVVVVVVFERTRTHTSYHHDIIHFTVARTTETTLFNYIVYSVMRVVCLRRSLKKLCFNPIWPLFNVIFKQYIQLRFKVLLILK